MSFWPKYWNISQHTFSLWKSDNFVCCSDCSSKLLCISFATTLGKSWKHFHSSKDYCKHNIYESYGTHISFKPTALHPPWPCGRGWLWSCVFKILDIECHRGDFHGRPGFSRAHLGSPSRMPCGDPHRLPTTQCGNHAEVRWRYVFVRMQSTVDFLAVKLDCSCAGGLAVFGGTCREELVTGPCLVQGGG